MQQEALQHQLDNQQPPSYPRILCDSVDMLAILNARGTVLLNMSFANTPEQLYIVKLASLATSFWTQPAVDGDEERHWVLNHMIPLIRDDIQQHLLSATTWFDAQTLQSQQRHIEILKESVATWRNMVSRALGLSTGFLTKKLDDLRGDSEAVLAADVRSGEIVRGVHSTYNRVEDHGSEYLGPLLRDERDQAFFGQIAFPELERKDTGYWLRV